MTTKSKSTHGGPPASSGAGNDAEALHRQTAALRKKAVALHRDVEHMHEDVGLLRAKEPESVWEAQTEWPMTAVAVVFLGAYAWPILDLHLAHPLRAACTILVYLTWALFAVDFIARAVLAPNTSRYVGRHLLDLASIALPVLRPLRLLRLVVLLRVLNRRAADSLHGRVVVYASGSTALVILCASLAVLDAERHSSQANITTFGDALWWAAVTITTVGYGDRYPVTTEGRFVAVGLMLAGITLIGVVTAAMASWLINRVRQVEETAQAATRADIADLRTEIAGLRELLEAASSAGQPATGA